MRRTFTYNHNSCGIHPTWSKVMDIKVKLMRHTLAGVIRRRKIKNKYKKITDFGDRASTEATCYYGINAKNLIQVTVTEK